MSLYVIVAALLIVVTLVSILFCVVLSLTKILFLGSPTRFVNHRYWRIGPWYVIILHNFFFRQFPDSFLNRTELAHWFKSTRHSHLYHLSFCAAPFRRWR